MKHKSIGLFVLTIIFLLLLFSLQSCSDMDFQPSGNYISGWATVNDTALVPGGYYALSVYESKANTFGYAPIRSDSLKLERHYNDYMVYYRIYDVPKGSYYFAITWIQYPPVGGKLPVLGTWGCDTTHDCTEHKLISFPNFTGASYNILAWADTSKKLN
jgi:hypothetical protein